MHTLTAKSPASRARLAVPTMLLLLMMMVLLVPASSLFVAASPNAELGSSTGAATGTSAVFPAGVVARPAIPGFSAVASRPGITLTPMLRGVNGTRTVLRDPSGDLLTIARDLQQVIAMWPDSSDPTTMRTAVIIDASSARLNLSHGLAFRDGYIYASSDILAWRWRYTPGSRTQVPFASNEVVVYNMSGGGRGGAPRGHTTRTMVFGPDNYLYIGISSLDNVDRTSYRSRVVRYNFSPEPTAAIRAGGINFDDFQVWADGLRNPLGLAFDSRGRLWESDNGPDDAKRMDRADLGDITNDSPPEEINLLNNPGGFYGYPYCFSLGNLTRPFLTDPRELEQVAWSDFLNDGVHTDAWCANRANNIPPVMGIPAHSSPISFRFFNADDGCGRSPDAFPCSMVGDAFITLHGSWNRGLPAGYSVVRIPFDANGNPKRELDYLLWTDQYQTKCTSPTGANLRCFRPSGLAFRDGVLYVSSGATGEVVRVTTGGEGGVISGRNHAVPTAAAAGVVSLLAPLLALFFF